ncbi:multifunctional acyl-CoA thioesterase I and protease I and lysophospholipase L1 [Oleiphilus messinensis]|uniref:Multifunctional acyl-CoA thioesterase I and protease I and lysophospholipase L1 n=1 Tax=Oleiphilus messinensis TaxID=141451 RepID=A0A1Y0IB55_9GAMM|nr:arylesterase [Oleiphilus messinensis]ARU57490.1 multifunctional acyl-CoA thioesterase I and protease I and lysophospholipase L1 [Oleiphilus messinensis]
MVAQASITNADNKPENATRVSSAQGETILVLGDSLSAAYGIATEQGWVHLLREILHTRGSHDVINASISGETTDGGARRITTLLDTHTPDILLLELGGNDGLRGFPTRVMRDNLQRIIDAAKAANCKVHLIGMHIPPNYGPLYTQQFHNVFYELAEANELTLTPFLLNGVELNEKMMQSDGIHPRAEAQPIMANNVLQALEPLLPNGNRP